MVYRGRTSEYSQKWMNFSQLLAAEENCSLEQIAELRANKPRPKPGRAGALLRGVLTRREIITYLQAKDSGLARPADRKAARRASDLDPANDRRVFQLTEDELVTALDKKACAGGFKQVGQRRAASPRRRKAAGSSAPLFSEEQVVRDGEKYSLKQRRRLQAFASGDPADAEKYERFLASKAASHFQGDLLGVLEKYFEIPSRKLVACDEENTSLMYIPAACFEQLLKPLFRSSVNRLACQLFFKSLMLKNMRVNIQTVLELFCVGRLASFRRGQALSHTPPGPSRDTMDTNRSGLDFEPGRVYVITKGTVAASSLPSSNRQSKERLGEEASSSSEDPRPSKPVKLLIQSEYQMVNLAVLFDGEAEFQLTSDSPVCEVFQIPAHSLARIIENDGALRHHLKTHAENFKSVLSVMRARWQFSSAKKNSSRKALEPGRRSFSPEAELEEDSRQSALIGTRFSREQKRIPKQVLEELTRSLSRAEVDKNLEILRNSASSNDEAKQRLRQSRLFSRQTRHQAVPQAPWNSASKASLHAEPETRKRSAAQSEQDSEPLYENQLTSDLRAIRHSRRTRRLANELMQKEKQAEKRVVRLQHRAKFEILCNGQAQSSIDVTQAAKERRQTVIRSTKTHSSQKRPFDRAEFSLSAKRNALASVAARDSAAESRGRGAPSSLRASVFNSYDENRPEAPSALYLSFQSSAARPASQCSKTDSRGSRGAEEGLIVIEDAPEAPGKDSLQRQMLVTRIFGGKPPSGIRQTFLHALQPACRKPVLKQGFAQQAGLSINSISRASLSPGQSQSRRLFGDKPKKTVLVQISNFA